MKKSVNFIKDEDFMKIVNIYFKKKIYYWIHGKRYKQFGKNSVILKPMRIIGRSFISIGEGVTIFDRVRMEAIKSWGDKEYKPNLIIGNNTTIQQNCHFTCANKITIGCGVSILPFVCITDIEHLYQKNMPLSETGIICGQVSIGNYVTIGMGARILGSKVISIGDNAIIGANAVVTRDIPENAIVGGVPARVIGYID